MTNLGFQASSLKAYLTTPSEVRTTFGKLREMGYRHLQLQWIAPAVPLNVTAEALHETGLTCIATQDSFQEVQNNFDYFLSMNQLWGSKSLCISTIPKELMTPEGLQLFADKMTRMAERLGEHGIGLSFHPLWFNYASIDGISAVDRVMDMLPQHVKLTLCVLQAVRAKTDTIALLEQYSGRVEICHFKDYALTAAGEEYLVPVGQGLIDWPPIFEACHRTGVSWGLTEQESWQKDAFLCAQESFDYITENGICPPLMDGMASEG
jgi:hypothetical protein